MAVFGAIIGASIGFWFNAPPAKIFIDTDSLALGGFKGGVVTKHEVVLTIQEVFLY